MMTLDASGQAWAQVADGYLAASMTAGLSDEEREMFRERYMAACRRVADPPPAMRLVSCRRVEG